MRVVLLAFYLFYWVGAQRFIVEVKTTQKHARYGLLNPTAAVEIKQGGEERVHPNDGENGEGETAPHRSKEECQLEGEEDKQARGEVDAHDGEDEDGEQRREFTYSFKACVSKLIRCRVFGFGIKFAEEFRFGD